MNIRNFHLCALVVALMAGSLASPGLVSPVLAAGKSVVVTMKDVPPVYVPAKLTVKVGTTVTWKNTGSSLHDVTTDPSMAQNKKDVSMPKGAKPFDSGFMPPGASWSYTLTVPGRYVYVCVPHEKDKMIGEITVIK